MPRFKLTLKCHVCTHRWKRIVKDLDAPDPPCPRCTAAQRTIGMDYTSNRAPAAVGMSNVTKAIDETARITMEDHGLTDLRDNVRTGETMAPKLPPRQQGMADNFFAPRGGRRASPMEVLTGRRNNNPVGARLNSLAQRAVAAGAGVAPTGSITADPVRLVHGARYKPPIRIINEGG